MTYLVERIPGNTKEKYAQETNSPEGVFIYGSIECVDIKRRRSRERE